MAAMASQHDDLPYDPEFREWQYVLLLCFFFDRKQWFQDAFALIVVADPDQSMSDLIDFMQHRFSGDAPLATTTGGRILISVSGSMYCFCVSCLPKSTGLTVPLN